VKRFVLAALLLTLLILSLHACGNRSPKLERISLSEWEQIRRSHEGQVLVVNVWASWCRNCVELFPSMAALRREYGPAGTQFVFLCLDELADPEEVKAAENFLAKAFGDTPGVSSYHYIFEEDFADIMDRLSLPSLPSILVYDTAGQLRHKLSADELSNGVSPADVEDAIESLIGPVGSA
jgi:thiol-disulfide isomerase/thioredoxin